MRALPTPCRVEPPRRAARVPIQTLELKNFTAFREARLDLSPGVNVFVGTNATGKTHAMKAMYALARGAQEWRAERPGVVERFIGVFRVSTGALVNLQQAGSAAPLARVVMNANRGRLNLHFGDTGGSVGPLPAHFQLATVFIPSREGLSLYEGFIAAYTKRELSLDQTYFDLAVALNASPLKEPLSDELTAAVRTLERILGGTVELDGPRFYVRYADGTLLEAHLVSEGMRKVATLLRLILNGEIARDSVLFWDEPEANLNPQLAVEMARLIAQLATIGVQVIVSSHDYLLTETLAMLAQREGGPAARFFSFVREADGVTVQGADSLDDLTSNPIREEFLRHYDRINGIDP